MHVVALIGPWICFVGCLVYAHRPLFFSKFTELPGRLTDPSSTIMVIFDHWYQFYSGRATWLELPYFYPQPHTLGYSDTFFLFGSLHALFRVAGFDIFAAYQGFLLLSAFIGFSFAFYFVRRQLGLSTWISTACALTIVFAAPMFSNIRYSQLHAVHFLMPIICCGWAACRALLCGQRGRLVGFSALCGLQLGVLFYNSFYVPWMFVFFCCLFVAIYLCLRPRISAAFVYKKRVAVARGLGTFVVMMGLPLIPFYYTYAPVLAAFGGYNRAQTEGYLPTVFDLFTVTEHTRDFAFSPSLLCLFFLALGTVLFLLRRKSEHEDKLAAVASLLLAVLCYWILMVNINGSNLWFSLVQFVPGSQAIRVPFRANLVLLIPALLASVYLFQIVVDVYTPTRFRRLGYFCLLVVAILASTEQFGKRYKTHSATMLRNMIAQVQIPQHCSHFFLHHLPDQRRRATVYYSRLAQVLAAGTGLPTINGYSSHFPKGGKARLRVDTMPYRRSVKSWVTAHKMEHSSCALDLVTLKLKPFNTKTLDFALK